MESVDYFIENCATISVSVETVGFQNYCCHHKPKGDAHAGLLINKPMLLFSGLC